MAQWFKQASRSDQGQLGRGQWQWSVEGRHTGSAGGTHLQEVQELVLEELLELQLPQPVLVALPSRMLVQDIREGHHGLLQLCHLEASGRLLLLPA